MKTLPLLAIGLLSSSFSLFAQDPIVSWSGNSGTRQFSDAGNWLGNVVPSAASHVQFEGVELFLEGVLLGGNYSIAELTVGASEIAFTPMAVGDGLDLGSGHVVLNASQISLGSEGNGFFRAGSMEVNGGSVNLYSRLEIDGTGSSRAKVVLGEAGAAVFNHYQGSFAVSENAALYLAGNSQGTYNLHSGATLEIGGTSLRGAESGGSYDFNLLGGRIAVTGSNLVTAVDSTIVSGRSVVNTNGLGAQWSGNITSAANQGEFAKEGAGTLLFDGDTRQMHAFATLHGTTQQTRGDTSSNGFLVGFGAGNTSTYEMDGGTLTIYSITEEGQSPVVGTLRIGDYGGTGVFNHNGGHVVMEEGTSMNVGNLSGVLGDQRHSGDGTYNLQGGTLTLHAGLHNVGRSNGVHTANGAFNLSSGTLIAEGGQLILGSRQAATVAGTGTLTQTGGLADFTNGRLLIGSYGHGVYHLNGGVLRIGGSNQLEARYGNPSGTYAFNLGGGKLEVAGSHLVTSVAATLVAGKTSTIDTAGLNATFNSSVSGTGSLRKEGEGILSVQTLAASSVEVDEGELRATSLTATEATLAEGTTLRTGSHTIDLLKSENAAVGSTTGPGIFRIGSGMRYEGGGTLLSSTEIAGTVQIGSSEAAGRLTAEQSVAILSGSRFELGIFENSTAAGSYSQFIGEQGFELEGSIALDLIFGEDVDFSSAFWQESGHVWYFFSGELEGDATFALTAEGGYQGYGSFDLVEDDANGVALRWQAIPEPSTYALLALSAAGLAVLRRGRKG